MAFTSVSFTYRNLCSPIQAACQVASLTIYIARAADSLAADLQPEEPMPRASVSQTVKVTLAPADIERAEALSRWLMTQPDLAPTGYASRSAVLREAMRRGLDSLERLQRKSERSE